MFRHTTEFTNCTRQASAVHAIYMQVPAFQACMCHGSGTRTRKNPRKAKTGNSGYVGLTFMAVIKFPSNKKDREKRVKSGLRCPTLLLYLSSWRVDWTMGGVGHYFFVLADIIHAEVTST